MLRCLSIFRWGVLGGAALAPPSSRACGAKQSKPGNSDSPRERSPDTRAGKKASPMRGAALLLVITSIAILTAISVDLAYESRVSLEAAAGARDELRATYMAKSAVGFSRLVLHFQQQLDQAAGAAGQLGQLAQARGLPAQLAQ